MNSEPALQPKLYLLSPIFFSSSLQVWPSFGSPLARHFYGGFAKVFPDSDGVGTGLLASLLHYMLS